MNLPNRLTLSLTLSDINHSKSLFDLPWRVMKIKTKIKFKKWDLNKI